MPERRPFIIESFDAARHDREGFASGVLKADNFLKLTSNKLSKAGNLRMFVATHDGVSILGFFALNAHSIDYQELPPKFARDRPSNGRIPAADIAMIAVAKSEQGKGYGSLLLADALKRISAAGKNLGISIAMLDVLDDGDEAAVSARLRLYRAFGFKSFEANPLRMWISVAGL